jgi:hypothetical protein
MEHQKIIINGFLFTLLYKITIGCKLSEYECVMINSQPKNKDLLFYRSYSDVGIFRLACCSNGHLIKGNHYLTSTAMHSDLQKFVIQNLDSIDTKESVSNWPAYDPEIAKYISADNVVRNPDPRSFHPFGIDFFGTNPLQYLNETCSYLKTSWKHDSNVHSQKMFKIFQDVGVNVSTSPIEKLKKLYESFSMYFKECFDADKPVHVIDFPIENFGYKISALVYSIRIKNKTVLDEQYDVFVMSYDLKCTKNQYFAFNGKYSFIYNIVPIDAEISEFGVYDKITCPGIVTFKPFDYVEQLPGDMQESERFIPRNEKQVHDDIPSYLFFNDICPDPISSFF